MLTFQWEEEAESWLHHYDQKKDSLLDKLSRMAELDKMLIILVDMDHIYRWRMDIAHKDWGQLFAPRRLDGPAPEFERMDEGHWENCEQLALILSIQHLIMALSWSSLMLL
jgi:hypothetical protein